MVLRTEVVFTLHKELTGMCGSEPDMLILSTDHAELFAFNTHTKHIKLLGKFQDVDSKINTNEGSNSVSGKQDAIVPEGAASTVVLSEDCSTHLPSIEHVLVDFNHNIIFIANNDLYIFKQPNKYEKLLEGLPPGKKLLINKAKLD